MTTHAAPHDPMRNGKPASDWAVLRRGTPAYLARPAAGSGPGLLVLHAWWGLNATFRRICDRFAGEGFVVLAPQLYGDDTVATTIDEARDLAEARNGPPMVEGTKDGLAALLGLPERTGRHVGIIGFALGAPWAIWLSQKHPEIAAVAVFYGTEGGNFETSNAAYLGHFAPGDEWEPDARVAELEDRLRRAGKDVTFHRYEGTRHWFFEPDRPEYDEAAASLAWDRTIEFLRARLQRALP